MSVAPKPPWQPTCVLRFEKPLDTSMGTARIVTDAGKAYLKALGNPQGPHGLACEWVGTQLARWLGLRTFDFALLTLDELDEIPFLRGGHAQPGPAFVTRAEKGHTWGGAPEELKAVENCDDVARLVVFDTWTLNCDRHPPNLSERKPNYDNVFLSEEGAARGRFRLVAMDHTHCFTCGRDLTKRLASIDRIRDERVYGLFSGFLPVVRDSRAAVSDALTRLKSFDAAVCRTFVSTIPAEWQVGRAVRAALCELICERARYVADNLMRLLAPTCWPQGEFDFSGTGETP